MYYKNVTVCQHHSTDNNVTCNYNNFITVLVHSNIRTVYDFPSNQRLVHGKCINDL